MAPFARHSRNSIAFKEVGMTVEKLLKRLQELNKEGYGSCRVELVSALHDGRAACADLKSMELEQDDGILSLYGEELDDQQ